MKSAAICGIKPSEFWKLTPFELQIIVEAIAEKEKAEWRRQAWFTAILLSPYIKKGRMIDPENLLPEFMRETEEKRPMTKEEVEKELKKLKEDLGIE